jgi:hypothetical protein
MGELNGFCIGGGGVSPFFIPEIGAGPPPAAESAKDKLSIDDSVSDDSLLLLD